MTQWCGSGTLAVLAQKPTPNGWECLFCSKNYAWGIYRKEAPKGRKKLPQTMPPPKGTESPNGRQKSKKTYFTFRCLLVIWCLKVGTKLDAVFFGLAASFWLKMATASQFYYQISTSQMVCGYSWHICFFCARTNLSITETREILYFDLKLKFNAFMSKRLCFRDFKSQIIYVQWFDVQQLKKL